MKDDEINLRRWAVRQVSPILILTAGLGFTIYRGDTIASDAPMHILVSPSFTLVKTTAKIVRMTSPRHSQTARGWSRLDDVSIPIDAD